MPQGSDIGGILQYFRDSHTVPVVIDTLAPHELPDQSV